MTKFTEGPWKTINADLTSKHFHQTVGPIVVKNKAKIEDINLISAAPELYEALEVMLADYREACDEWDGDAFVYGESVIEQAKSALAKARGEA